MSEDNEEKISSFKDFVLEIVKVLIISLIIVIPIRAYVVQPFYVDGASMEPNFYDGEYLIVDEISYRFNDPQRGDIVIFHPPNNEKVYYIKRIIALPGETIDIKNGVITVYKEGEEEGLVIEETEYLSEDYQLLPSEKYHEELEEDEYYLMGDNRRSSLDSRRLGPISYQYIKGKVLLRAFPFDRFSIIENPIY